MSEQELYEARAEFECDAINQYERMLDTLAAEIISLQSSMMQLKADLRKLRTERKAK
jgi:hypothetical protein